MCYKNSLHGTNKALKKYSPTIVIEIKQQIN